MTKSQKILQWFRRVAIAEGISFLVLLCIAMPLKYFADSPMAVKVVGYMHGFLFIAFVVLAWETKNALNKGFIWFIGAFIASLLPFGTFVLDNKMKKEEKFLVK